MRLFLLHFFGVSIFSGFFAFGEIVEASGWDREFTLTGYYSPLPHQNFYLTGSYESEKRLNGQGIAGADGTPVFPGMIAAPKNYPFGTKICLPNFGCGSVHDRGGAIVNKGERELARHDRLDLWMGYGEEGLMRALGLGVQHVTGTIYPSDSPVEISVNFQAATPLGRIIDLPEQKNFGQNLSLGSSGDAVKSLQNALIELGYFDHSDNTTPTGIFDRETQAALLDFQLEYFVVYSSDDLGSGVFGPKTRERLGEIWYAKKVQEKITQRWQDLSFEKNIEKGARSAEVMKLQEILVREEFMDHVPTGYFGKVTKEALISFQLDKGLIPSKNSPGAGQVGPKTREILNTYINKERHDKALETQQQFALKKDEQLLRYYANSNHNYLRIASHND